MWTDRKTLAMMPTLKLALLCPDADAMIDQVQRYVYENICDSARAEFDSIRHAERTTRTAAQQYNRLRAPQWFRCETAQFTHPRIKKINVSNYQCGDNTIRQGS